MSNLVQITNRDSTSNIVGTERIRTDFGGQCIAHDGITLIFSHLTGLRDLVSFASASRGLYQHYLHSFQWDSFVQKYFPDSYKDWQCDLQPNLLSGLQGRGFYKQLMQVGILKAWKENYRPQRIYTLTELAARSDVTPNFYQMGI
ncbi:MAG: hypothetical protein WA347_03005 [Rhabdochlamydiaceae bacterium]